MDTRNLYPVRERENDEVRRLLKPLPDSQSFFKSQTDSMSYLICWEGG